MFAQAAAGTAQRAAGRRLVVVQDTSELALGGRRAKAAGFGPVGKGGALRGLLLHAALALEADSGAALGLAHGAIWNRDQGPATDRRGRKTKDKESQRWIEGAAHVAQVFASAAGDALLFSFVANLPEMGRYQACIPAAPGRPARTATLVLRWSPVSLCRPRNATEPGLPAAVDLTLVEVGEIDPPAGVEAINWRLLTTHAVGSVEEAREIVDFYRMRWTIEEFFRTLKTAAFDIEAADIGDPQAMMNFTAAASVAAVTVMQLVRARDGNTDQDVADAFEPEDQPLIEAISQRLEGKTERQKNPHAKGALAFASWVMARLGGWTGYYGKPGPQVMRRGIEDFQRIKFGASLRLRDV